MEIDPFSHVSIREYFEKLMDEREDKYNIRFDALDKSIIVALQAKGSGKEQGHWVVGTVIAVCALLLSLGALFLARAPFAAK